MKKSMKNLNETFRRQRKIERMIVFPCRALPIAPSVRLVTSRCSGLAMQAAAAGGSTFEEATKQVRDRNRHLGRRLSRRAVGGTLLLKGRESEVCT